MTLITAAMIGASTSGDVIDDTSFGDLHKMLKPQPGESRWMEIEWYPSVWGYFAGASK
jgi:hypothetical protein